MACVETFALGILIYKMIKQGIEPTKIPEHLGAKGIRLVIAQIHLLSLWGLNTRSRFVRSLLSKTIDGLLKLVMRPDVNLVAKKEEEVVKMHYEKPDVIEELSQLLALCQQKLCDRLIIVRGDLKRLNVMEEFRRMGVDIEFYTMETVKEAVS